MKINKLEITRELDRLGISKTIQLRIKRLVLDPNHQGVRGLSKSILTQLSWIPREAPSCKEECPLDLDQNGDVNSHDFHLSIRLIRLRKHFLEEV